MVSIQNVSLFLAVLLTGLLAGLFYSYACSVNIGLGRLTDEEYLRAMQSINEGILNPVFFLSFLGALVLLPFASWMNHNFIPTGAYYFLLSATIIYVIGVFGITAVGNVPLNEALARFTIDGASPQELFVQRQKFELTWNSYHTIRTVAAVLSFALSLVSIFKIK
ncbi:MAG TPA: anthrone oxygenase family protein [Cyclobacteriaceae bacterium]